MKIQKKKNLGRGVGGGGEGGRVGGSRGLVGSEGGCDRRIEVFVKIQTKKNFWGGGGGVRVDVNEELKFL